MPPNLCTFQNTPLGCKFSSFHATPSNRVGRTVLVRMSVVPPVPASSYVRRHRHRHRLPVAAHARVIRAVVIIVCHQPRRCPSAGSRARRATVVRALAPASVTAVRQPAPPLSVRQRRCYPSAGAMLANSDRPPAILCSVACRYPAIVWNNMGFLRRLSVAMG